MGMGTCLQFFKKNVGVYFKVFDENEAYAMP